MNKPALKVATDKTSVTQTLAQFAAALEYAAIPKPVLQVARHCLLDWFGVTLAGSETNTVRLLREVSLAPDEAQQVTLIGGPGRSSCANAALINGTAGHALDFDDVHYAMPGHPTAAIAPALIAQAEHDAINGRELLCALVAGVEIACRSGLFVTRDHYLRGWHATGTIGAFGAAVAVTRAMNLDAQTTALAMGIAATQAGGLKSMFGTMCKPLHAGKAAGNGLLAAQLAAKGFSSHDDILECEQGYGEVATSGTDSKAALAKLGEHYQIRGLMFKYHAACYGTHATIEAARQLVGEQSLTPGQITAVEIRVPTRCMRVCNISHPKTGLEAKFSLRMACAMALCGESTADINCFTTRLCRKPALRKLLDKMTVVAVDKMSDGTCELQIRLGKGKSYSVSGDVSIPAEDLDQQEQRLLHKYRTLSTPVLGGQLSDELAQMILNLDQLPDIRALMALTRA